MRQGYIHNVRLTTLMSQVAQFSLGMAVTLLFTSAAWAEAGIEKAENQQQPSSQNLDKDAVNRTNLKPISIPKILQLSEIEHPHTSAQILLGQSPAVPNTPSQEIVQVTRVKANPSDKGVEVILQTSVGKQLQVVNRSTGNSFIADIPNAQLRLPSGEAFTFRSEKPLAGITEITVTNYDANTIRITVTGEASLPVVELFDGDEGLIFGVASAASATQQPTPEPDLPESQTQPSQPSAQDDEPIELVVTGEQDGYRVPNASTATRTDTPLRDIPQSIQVVPRQVLEDRKPRTVTEAVETVSGVLDGADYFGGPGGGRIIRGFFQSGNYRNGTRDIVGSSSGLTALGTIEQIEVLKGPASVLFGAVEPGGIVNVITRQPLSTPYYNLAFEAGNFGFYQPSLDFSGPLTSDKTLLYRFIANYQDSGSFQDFVNQSLTTIAPSFTFNVGDKTVINLYYEYFHLSGIPEVTTTLTNDGRRPPQSRYLGYPQFGDLNTTQQRYGYSLSHQLSDNWQIRNGFSVAALDRDEQFTAVRQLIDDRFLRLSAVDRDVTEDNYYGQIDLLGKFNTGSVSHQLLVGFDFNRFVVDTDFSQDNTLPFLDIFNPNYDVPEAVNDFFFTSEQSVQTYGIYLQDQISLLNNLKLLIGGRIDITSQNSSFREVEAPEQNDTAFSPRVGLVYQPSNSVSLYASYSRSFNPTTGTDANGEAFEPSRGTQYEVGVKADFLEGRLSTTLSAYHLTKTNIETLDRDNPDFTILTGEQRSQGIELDVVGEILPGWKAIASYAYTDAEVTKDNTIPIGNRVFNVPENQASLWTTYEFQKGDLKGLGFGLGLFYVGERQGDSDNSFTVPDYLRTDTTIYYRRDNFNAAINIRNLFNIDYISNADNGRIFLQSGAPFTIIGSISWTF